MKRWRWALIGGLFIAWTFTLGTTELWPGRADQVEKDLTQKRKALKEIKKELSLTKEKEKQIQGKETSVLESLYQMESELYKKGKELKEMEAQLGQVKEKLHQTKNQIGTLNKGMERTKEEFFSRLTALYKMDRIPPEIFLFTSQSYSDLLKIDKYLRVIIDFDARLVDTHRQQLALKERYQGTLMEDQSQWQRSISEVEGKKDEIKRIRKTKRALLKSIQDQKVVYRRVIGELEERSRELQVLIDKLAREKKVVAYGGLKTETIKGKLMAPVQGSVVSQFKERGQHGVEIKAPIGAEVRAVLSGKVLYSDWFKGFGNVMIIDHGDHTFTVSAYCSQLLKKAGDVVSQGETIALVGSAGSLKGPCLYFEIRHRGKPQDPMEWIGHPGKIVSFTEGSAKERKGL